MKTADRPRPVFALLATALVRGAHPARVPASASRRRLRSPRRDAADSLRDAGAPRNSSNARPKQRWLATAAILVWGTVALAAADVSITPDRRTAIPAPGATNVCPDTPLRLTFDSAPTLGASGKIRIVDAADQSVVDTIDIAVPTAVQTIGGLPGFKYRPLALADRTVTIFPKNHALAYDRTYYVTIDAGVFKNATGDSAALTAPSAWRFTTRRAPPMAGTARLVVAADGTGDFCTVQAALDFLPVGNTAPTTILLRRGTYSEIVFFTDKHAITLLGEDRKQSVIAAANNAALNPDFGGNPFGGPTPNPSAADVKTGPIYRRGLFTAHRVNDLTLTNLTLRNTTPQGGGQAETIILNGTTAARAILKDVALFSFQDTLQINGQAYLANCYIEGDVDFMWGTGPCFFENCTLRALRTGAYYTQIRNPPTNHGYVCLRCTFDGAPGVTGNFLSRVQPSRFPASEVVLLDCTLTAAVSEIGWQFQGGAGGAVGDTSAIRFWEFNSRAASGQPIDAGRRLPASRQLKSPDDLAKVAAYRDPVTVLGGNWNPKAAAIFKPAAPPR